MVVGTVRSKACLSYVKSGKDVLTICVIMRVLVSVCAVYLSACW